jgi:hypothetical protein
VAKLNRASSVRATETRQRSRTEAGLRVLFALPVYFLKHYLQRGLFRAGIYGVSLAAISAFGRWLRDAKMYEHILASDARAAAESRRAPEKEATAPIPQDAR